MPHSAAFDALLDFDDFLEQQDEIEAILRDYPSLAARADALLAGIYLKAVRLALSETGLDRSVVPADLPTVQELLEFDAEA